MVGNQVVVVEVGVNVGDAPDSSSSPPVVCSCCCSTDASSTAPRYGDVTDGPGRCTVPRTELGLALGADDGTALGAPVGEGVGDPVGSWVGAALGLGETVGGTVGGGVTGALVGIGVGNLVGFLDGLGVGRGVGLLVGLNEGMVLGSMLGKSLGAALPTARYDPGRSIFGTCTGAAGTALGAVVGYLRTVGGRVGEDNNASPLSVDVVVGVGRWTELLLLLFWELLVGVTSAEVHGRTGAGVGNPGIKEVPGPGLLAFWLFAGLFSWFLLAEVGATVPPPRELELDDPRSMLVGLLSPADDVLINGSVLVGSSSSADKELSVGRAMKRLSAVCEI